MACPHGERFRCRHCDGFEPEQPPRRKIQKNAWVLGLGLYCGGPRCTGPAEARFQNIPATNWDCSTCGEKFTTIDSLGTK